jgi:hypothetical protein
MVRDRLVGLIVGIVVGLVVAIVVAPLFPGVVGTLFMILGYLVAGICLLLLLLGFIR